MKKLFFYFKICLLVFSASQALSQTSESSGREFLSHAYKNAVGQYEDFIGSSSQIFNGDEYVEYDYRINGYPCFDAEFYSMGWIVYNDMLFDSVELKYDVYKQQVVIQHYDGKGYSKDLILANEWIKEFFYEGHYFVKIEENLAIRSDLDDGFYEILYDGKTETISKRIKLYNEVIDDQKIKKEFITKDKFYLLHNDQFHHIKNKRSLLNTLVDRKREVKKFIKRNKLKFRKELENSLLQVSRYYDTLNP